MESALSFSIATNLAVFTISKALNRHLTKKLQPRQCVRARSFAHISVQTPSFASLATHTSCSSSSLRRSLCAVLPLNIPRRVKCVSSSASSFGIGGGSSGGDIGSGDGSGGGGDGGPDGGDSKSKLSSGGGEEVSASSSEVIILDVGGMTCGGCAASVKRILENQPQVSSASVNLTTETAVVWPVSEAKVVPNWQKQLGEALAKHLTNCGFSSNLRHLGADNFFKVFERKVEEKRNRLKESGRELAVSWALCAVCLVGHLSHFFEVKASWIHAFHSTGFHLSLSLFTLLGPGRHLIIDGAKSLFRGTPNMNTLVGLGALSSFTVSSLAAFLPKLMLRDKHGSERMLACSFRFGTPSIVSPDVKVQQRRWEQMAIMSFLAGLPPEFESAKSQVLSSFEVTSLQEVFSRILRTESTPHVPFNGALVNRNNNSAPRRPSYGNKGSNSQGFETQKSDIMCNYCKKPDHTKFESRKLQYKNQQNHTAHIASTGNTSDKSVLISADEFAKFSQYQESLESSSPVVAAIADLGKSNMCLVSSSSNWVIDSGAIDHMTGSYDEEDYW